MVHTHHHHHHRGGGGKYSDDQDHAHYHDYTGYTYGYDDWAWCIAIVIFIFILLLFIPFIIWAADDSSSDDHTVVHHGAGVVAPGVNQNQNVNINHGYYLVPFEQLKAGETAKFKAGQVVSHGGKLYRCQDSECTVDTDSEEWTPEKSSHWTQIDARMAYSERVQQLRSGRSPLSADQTDTIRKIYAEMDRQRLANMKLKEQYDEVRRDLSTLTSFIDELDLDSPGVIQEPQDPPSLQFLTNRVRALEHLAQTHVTKRMLDDLDFVDSSELAAMQFATQQQLSPFITQQTLSSAGYHTFTVGSLILVRSADPCPSGFTEDTAFRGKFLSGTGSVASGTTSLALSGGTCTSTDVQRVDGMSVSVCSAPISGQVPLDSSVDLSEFVRERIGVKVCSKI